MKNNRKIPLYYWRRLGQTLFFLVFIFLFIKTDYSGSDQLAYAVNVLFRIDPLLAAAAMLAGRTLISLLLPALFTLLLTLVLGRFFCGWFCPMGTLIDLAHRLVPPHDPYPAARYRRLKYYILAFVLTAALFQFPVAGYLDPFSILVRGLTLAVYPAFNQAATGFFTFTYTQAPAWVNTVTEPVYAALKVTVLPFSQKVYALSLLSLTILLAIFLLERSGRRFFCKNICPLGGMLALTANFALLQGHGGANDCGKCRLCRNICRMGAIDRERRISKADCNLCLDCLALCPRDRIRFSFARPTTGTGRLGITRRAFVGTLAAGTILPAFLETRALAGRPDPSLVRPPGAIAEADFPGRCVRCGECMKVCIGNGLHPAFLEAGIEGMFSPILKSRTGYCEFNCTLCGQVCPTGAIANLALADKQQFRMGLAVFNRDLCLPHARGVPCIVCEEHCPTPEKAIKFRQALFIADNGEEIPIKQPYLVEELCVGCGICEYKCPLPGRAAVNVIRADSTSSSRQGGYY